MLQKPIKMSKMLRYNYLNLLLFFEWLNYEGDLMYYFSQVSSHRIMQPVIGLQLPLGLLKTTGNVFFTYKSWRMYFSFCAVVGVCCFCTATDQNGCTLKINLCGNTYLIY